MMALINGKDRVIDRNSCSSKVKGWFSWNSSRILVREVGKEDEDEEEGEKVLAVEEVDCCEEKAAGCCSSGNVLFRLPALQSEEVIFWETEELVFWNC